MFLVELPDDMTRLEFRWLGGVMVKMLNL